MPRTRPRLHVKRHEVTQPHDEAYRLIPLTQGKNAIVDAEDFERLSQWNWFARKHQRTFYAERTVHLGSRNNTKHVPMPEEILGYKGQVDHKDGDGLNNRKSNLRPATSEQNEWNKKKRHHNTSGFKGVHFRKDEGKWRARIGFRYERINLGQFDTAEEAAHVYDAAAKEIYGEFASLNF